MSDIFKNGKKYFVRTVTFYTVGKLVRQDKRFLVFKNASCVADTGPFQEALQNGTFHEVEHYVNEVIVAKGAIIDATIWQHDLPS